MQRFAGVGLFLIFLLSFGLSGCGGGGSSSSGNTTKQPASVTLSPTPISMERGAVGQVFVSVKDAEGNALFNQTITYSSSNTAVLTVSNGGLLCAGTWDSLTAPIVCTPAASPGGTSNLTAMAGGITSNVVVVSVHDHVDSITLSPTSVDCDSQDATEIFTATAFNGINDITSTVGTFSWLSSQSGVATIDVAGPSNPGPPLLTANQAQVKAQHPGISNISASISGTNSVAAPFTTCLPASITIDVPTPVLPDTSTSFSIATSATKTLESTVIDTTGATITGMSLIWTSSQPAVATVDNTGKVTGVAPGVSIITASCTPTTCNTGTGEAAYSNPVTATITGTATTPNVYATTTTAPVLGGHTDLIPITTTTAGTAIALPTDAKINSLLINPAGTRAYLGSSPNGLVVVDVTNNTVLSTVTNVLGKALTISPNGQFVVTSDTSAGRVYVYDSVNSLVTTLSIPGATGASFTSDSFKAYIVGGNLFYQYSPSLTLRTITMSDVANDVAVNTSGQFAYTAGGETGEVAARSTCRNDSNWTPEDPGVGATATPNLIVSASTGDLLAVEGSTSTMDKVTPTIDPPAAGTSCPATLTSDALATADWNGGCCAIASFTPRQIIVTPNGAKAYVTSDQTVLLGYDIAGNTTFSVAIGGASTFTGGALSDSTKVYVGGSDNKVHVIDVAGGTESATVSLSFTPDLVAVRPK